MAAPQNGEGWLNWDAKRKCVLPARKVCAMGIKEELHKIEELVSKREAEDAIAVDKKQVSNGEAAQKKLAAEEVKEAGLEADLKGDKKA